MTDLLWCWPNAARFDRTIPKTKFYEHANVTTTVKEKFVSEVQRITWAYKLSDTTIRLAGTTEVPEIQVFTIEAKAADVPESVLTAIDKAVQTPIIFEITRASGTAQRIRMVAAHKQVITATVRLGRYYTTAWQDATAERQPLPTALTLPALYTALLAPLTPLESRSGEGLPEVAARLEAVQKLEREITALERKLGAEKQLNRKVELRRTLKTRQAELAGLR